MYINQSFYSALETFLQKRRAGEVSILVIVYTASPIGGAMRNHHAGALRIFSDEG